ncbi:hypothetical protein F441_14856 [Phytophthora nicotianae CJ01A1]|nr:hypothetical protein F441_14856 [Phytophthora nicotianae CJ01A1]
MARKNNAKAQMISVLTTRCADNRLAKLTDGASKEVGSYEKLAAALAQQQRRSWQSADKNANDIFALLKLGNWEIMMTARYGDDVLAKMLEVVRKKEATEEVATQFQITQFTQWLNDRKKNRE